MNFWKLTKDSLINLDNVDAADVTVDFSKEQLPLLLRELLLYERISSVALSIVGLSILFANYKFCRWMCDRAKKDDWDTADRNVAVVIPSIFFIAIGSIMFFCNFLSAIKVFFTPRLYLLEYLRFFPK